MIPTIKMDYKQRIVSCVEGIYCKGCKQEILPKKRAYFISKTRIYDGIDVVLCDNCILNMGNYVKQKYNECEAWCCTVEKELKEESKDG